MTPAPNVSAPSAGTANSYAVAAHAAVRVSADAIPALRLNPGKPVGEPFAPSFLKHADEQTVVGLAAVLKAVHDHGLGATAFAPWGVIAASRFLGRATLAVSLQRFAAEGAWGVSPHLIPHRSLHSVSGTISQALQIHGPNFGVGGGPGGAAEAMLVGAALLAEGNLPGLWVVLTGWESEPVVDLKAAAAGNGLKPPARFCGAAALALVPAVPGWHGLGLHVKPAGQEKGRNGAPPRPLPTFGLESLLQALAAGTREAGWRLEGGGTVRLAAGGLGPPHLALPVPGNGAAEGTRQRGGNGR